MLIDVPPEVIVAVKRVLAMDEPRCQEDEDAYTLAQEFFDAY
jgi:hypothetical protein